MAGWMEFAGRLIDAKYNDRVAALVFCEQELTRWIDGKIARCLALRGFVFHISQSTGGLFDCEYDDTVVTSIRTVQAFDRNVVGVLLADIAVWQVR